MFPAAKSYKISCQRFPNFQLFRQKPAFRPEFGSAKVELFFKKGKDWEYLP
jgi:hypothetical protein